MEHYLTIEEFGKIKRAKLKVAPFTLFVGDNNSGKSYLLSLLWGIYTADETSALFSDLRGKAYDEVYEAVCNFLYHSTEGNEQEMQIPSVRFLEILNGALMQNKNRFVADIFNSAQVRIERLSVEMREEFDVSIKSWREGEQIKITYNAGKTVVVFPMVVVEANLRFAAQMLCRRIFLWFLKGQDGHLQNSNVVYLPAARTGFMLAKNVINRVGRQMAFDISEFYGMEREEEMEPFTKPIIRFLDALENLSLDHKTEYGEIAAWMEQNMAHGEIQYGSEANNEIRYVPAGSGASLPLRTTSAVVTELTPLLLLLKYKRKINAICYEEPEMCLHPQLQQEMGRLLIRLVNSGISVVAATHSDIIIQHINNMCKISRMGNSEKLMEKLGLAQEDLIEVKDVAVYQFTDFGNHSAVAQVAPEDGQFQVGTFTDALMKILEQTSEVQDFEGE